MTNSIDWYEIWQQATLTVTAVVALLGFLRGLEHRKDSNFRDLVQSLSDSESPVLRASAAAQLASYASYRRYFVLDRPYRKAAFLLVLSALKRPEEQKHVRQQLANTLRELLPDMEPESNGLFDLIDVHMNELILHHFPFTRCDLTGAQLQASDLGNASFVDAKLWKAQFRGSKCTNADFSNAKLWDTKFEDVNFHGADFERVEFNDGTSFANASLADANLSDELRELARQQGATNL